MGIFPFKHRILIRWSPLEEGTVHGEDQTRCRGSKPKTWVSWIPGWSVQKGEEKRSLSRRRNDFPSQRPSAPCWRFRHFVIALGVVGNIGAAPWHGLYNCKQLEFRNCLRFYAEGDVSWLINVTTAFKRPCFAAAFYWLKWILYQLPKTEWIRINWPGISKTYNVLYT